MLACHTCYGYWPGLVKRSTIYGYYILPLCNLICHHVVTFQTQLAIKSVYSRHPVEKPLAEVNQAASGRDPQTVMALQFKLQSVRFLVSFFCRCCFCMWPLLFRWKFNATLLQWKETQQKSQWIIEPFLFLCICTLSWLFFKFIHPSLKPLWNSTKTVIQCCVLRDICYFKNVCIYFFLFILSTSVLRWIRLNLDYIHLLQFISVVED